MFFNTTDLTRWGIGLLRRLHAVEVDLNFWECESRIEALEDHASTSRSIDYFTIVGDQLTIHMSDHTLEGPITVPVAAWNRRTDNHGQWAPLTVYNELDIFDNDGSLYFAQITFTSPAVFDANATDGMGHLLYGLLLTAPGDVVPVGGTTGQFLAKLSNADFDFHYVTATLAALGDVALVSPHDSGDLLSWNGTHWQNVQQSTLVLTLPQTRFAAVVLGATGTVSLDPALGDVFTVTPTGSITLNAATAPAGSKITLVVTTSGTSSYNVTPTTNFKSTGALATGTASGKVFTISFVGDGTNLNETSRTLAM